LKSCGSSSIEVARMYRPTRVIRLSLPLRTCVICRPLSVTRIERNFQMKKISPLKPRRSCR